MFRWLRESCGGAGHTVPLSADTAGWKVAFLPAGSPAHIRLPETLPRHTLAEHIEAGMPQKPLNEALDLVRELAKLHDRDFVDGAWEAELTIRRGLGRTCDRPE
jgi:hypothetical protein